MIKIEKTFVCGMEHAVRGMRNPKNSWDASDSQYYFGPVEHYVEEAILEATYELGPKDLDLATKLANAGTDHGKFLRMITVYADVTAPFYWWKEYDTYKVGTVANSCSTMHKLTYKEFERDDFSHEHLDVDALDTLDNIVFELNKYRTIYLNPNYPDEYKKNIWWQMIQLLPSSYNQKRTVMVNYAVLKNMYHARKNHKLDEWHIFCDWIGMLPYAKELIIGE